MKQLLVFVQVANKPLHTTTIVTYLSYNYRGYLYAIAVSINRFFFFIFDMTFIR